MSYEAWGDDDDGFDSDRLHEAGWWPGEQAEEVTNAIKALRSEQVYEGGNKANGISVRFLMRLTMLEYAAGLKGDDDPLVVEARNALDAQVQS